MTKLSTTAKRLDIVFRILEIATMIGFVAVCVGLGIIAAGGIFRLSPEQIGSGFDTVDVGFLTLRYAPEFAPEEKTVILFDALEMLLTLPAFWLGRCCIRSIRSILGPMKEGQPFRSVVSFQLRRIALYTLWLGILLNLSRLVNYLILSFVYRLPEVLVGERFIHATLNGGIDLTFLVISAVFLLLSYVFRYGEELQQLSDETV